MGTLEKCERDIGILGGEKNMKGQPNAITDDIHFNENASQNMIKSIFTHKLIFLLKDRDFSNFSVINNTEYSKKNISRLKSSLERISTVGGKWGG